MPSYALLFKLHLFFLFAAISFYANAQSLIVQVNDIRSEEGAILVAVYNKSNYMHPTKVVRQLRGKPKIGTITIIGESFEPGEYALAVIHDENYNEKMDFNFFGIPKEPYGFSNNPGSRFKKPKYEATKITIGPEGKYVSIDLFYW
jgi:uncharacterized protein (DUF2141 family)